MNPLVVHCKRARYDVYIGRPSKWGNPFPLPTKANRTERLRCLQRYRKWLRTQPELLAALPELKGKTLGCWCAPRLCHGDILAELANAEESPRLVRGSDSDDLGEIPILSARFYHLSAVALLSCDNLNATGACAGHAGLHLAELLETP